MSGQDFQSEVALKVVGPPRWTPEPDPRVPPGDPATLLTIDAEGVVSAFSGKVEYGQGIRNGFAMEIADELDIAVDSVRVVLGDTALVPQDRGTTGSASTRTVGIQLRRAAATARQTIIDLAATRLEVDSGALSTREGSVVFGGGSKSVRYADLLSGHTLTVAVPDEVALKNVGDFRVMGKPSSRIDAVSRVTGSAKYAQDVVIPGMLYGKILRPPSYGATLRQIDTARAERIGGVVSIVQDGDFVGVVAEREDVAEYAIEAIRARWEESRDTASDWNLPALLKERAGESVALREEGSLQSGFASADRVLESTYYVPYISNAQMEPSASVARWDGDDLTVWCANRGPFAERDSLAEMFGIDPKQVRVIAAEIGGSFGTKSPSVSHEAARLAKAVDAPVRVSYDRAEEFGWSTVRPAATFEIKSGVDVDGKIVSWDYAAFHAGENAFRGQRGADTPYDVDNVRISVAASESPLQAGSYRSLGGATNHFARELHMDEIAISMGIDPLEFRLRNLSHERLRGCLTAAAEAFGWESREKRPGVGYGMAIGYDAGSFTAQIVEVAVENQEARVTRVTVGFDCGLVVNPDGARNQIEGSIVMGMGTALWEAVEFDGGRILNDGFARYRVPRITDTPEIEVVFTGGDDVPSSGAGEPGIVPIAAAIANAVRDATGTAIEELPIVPRL
ncbi:MAG: xanthine dehydrogenase family protein molybdopterin-binding subunit [Chloroflexi bacterium]|nr:xanthine dehydrogenase family protein molybdopterin-binding subunit [Chloroflexota bacterium]